MAVARNVLVKSPEMLSYVARNCVILNDIVASLSPFTALVSSHRRIKNEIPLVSCRGSNKNESYLKTDTNLSLFLCALHLVKFGRRESAFQAT